MAKIMRCGRNGHGGDLPDDWGSDQVVNWDGTGGDWNTFCDCVCEGCCCNFIAWQVVGHGYDLNFSYDSTGVYDDQLFSCTGSSEEITDVYVYFDSAGECPKGGLDADLHFTGPPDPPFVIPNAADYDCITVVLTYADGSLATRCTVRLIKEDACGSGEMSRCCDLLLSSTGSGSGIINVAWTSAFTDCIGLTVAENDIQYIEAYFGGCPPEGDAVYQFGDTETAVTSPIEIQYAQLEDCVCLVFYNGSGQEIARCSFDGTNLLP